jgi:glutathione-specific gamma-glutamylcyclotransferase
MPREDIEGDVGVDEEYWIFGYGSLIFKCVPDEIINCRLIIRPPPHFDRRIPGFVTSFVRRFWQTSCDHRGTREAPGRSAVLIPRNQWNNLDDEHDSPEDEVTWGSSLPRRNLI